MLNLNINSDNPTNKLETVSMNWYKNFLKTAIKGTYTILAGQMAKQAVSIIGHLISNKDVSNGPVARDFYCDSLKKNIGLEINLDIDETLDIDFAIGGDYEKEPSFNAEQNKIIDLGEEKVILNIFIRSPSILINRNELYQEAFYVIDHELEHRRDFAENKISEQELLRRENFQVTLNSGWQSENLIKRYTTMVEYLLFSPEFQSIVRSVARSAKKRGSNFEQLLKEKINGLLYSNNSKLKETITKELGYNNVIETENKILDNFRNIQKEIFTRPNSQNWYDKARG